jgi:hypothetical protein
MRLCITNGPIVHSQWYMSIQPQWNNIDRKNEELRENPIQMSFCLPKILHGLTQMWTQASTVTGQQLTAWAMAQPSPAWKISVNILKTEKMSHFIQPTGSTSVPDTFIPPVLNWYGPCVKLLFWHYASSRHY